MVQENPQPDKLLECPKPWEPGARQEAACAPWETVNVTDLLWLPETRAQAGKAQDAPRETDRSRKPEGETG